jgi:hypothetical protein
MRSRAVTGLVAVALVVACDDQTPSMGPRIGGASALHVTGEAARQIEEFGQFRLAGPAAGELAEAQAIALARAYMIGAAPWIGGVWERDRGARIDVRRLTACPRAYYAASAFALPTDAQPSLQQAVGPQWLVSMCSPDGMPVLSVAVSALATDLRVEGGRLVGPGGGQFTSAGIPARLSGVPVAPEEAVRLAAAGVGRRVTDVPELVLAGGPYAPQLAKWRLRLESPVTARGAKSGVAQTTSEVYLGFGETWNWTGLQTGRADPTPRQVPNPARGAARGMVLLVPRPGYPIAYERATIERP